MSTLSFGFSSLSPSTTEEAWFPRLESDELRLVNDMEDAIRLEIEKMRNHPYPKYVGASTPEEEDDSTVGDDDDQEEKTREAQDAASAADIAAAVGAGDGDGEDPVSGDEVDEDDEGEEEDMSEEEGLTGDEDMEMEADEGLVNASDEFDSEVDIHVTDSAEE